MYLFLKASLGELLLSQAELSNVKLSGRPLILNPNNNNFSYYVTSIYEVKSNANVHALIKVNVKSKKDPIEMLYTDRNMFSPAKF